jgi:hypothetical protein
MATPGNGVVPGALPNPPPPQPNNPPLPQGGHNPIVGANAGHPIFNDIDASLAARSPPKHSNPKWNVPDKIDGT